MTANKKVKKAKKKIVRSVKKAAGKKPAAKKVVKKAKPSAKKTAKKLLPASALLNLEVVGEIIHYFPHVSAGVIKLAKDLKSGETVQIKGHTTDFKQAVDSLQVDHVPVAEAKKGQEIGLKVKNRVRIGDTVYRVK